MRSRRMRVGAHVLSVAPLPAIAALLILALMISAGFWQLRRAEEKRAIAIEQAYRAEKQALVLTPSLIDATGLEKLRHRRSTAKGRYRSDKQYLLDNRTHHGVAGYEVLTPFRLRGSDVHVLVNRGWLPVGPDRRRLPDLGVSDALLLQQGVIVPPPAPGLSLGPSGYDNQDWPRVVQRVEMTRIQEQLGSPLLPFVVRLSKASENGYTRDWPSQPGLTPERHVGYAVQWFALAAALVVLCVWVAVKREKEPGHER